MKHDFTSIFFTPLKAINPLEALKESIRKNEDEILDINRQQLDRGLDSEGKSLGRYASFSYKGRWQPIDLKLSGDFRDKFSIEITNKHTEIFSQDSKESLLKKRYGKDIFGVPAPYIDNVGDIIRNDFVNGCRAQLSNLRR